MTANEYKHTMTTSHTPSNKVHKEFTHTDNEYTMWTNELSDLSYICRAPVSAVKPFLNHAILRRNAEFQEPCKTHNTPTTRHAVEPRRHMKDKSFEDSRTIHL